MCRGRLVVARLYLSCPVEPSKLCCGLIRVRTYPATDSTVDGDLYAPLDYLLLHRHHLASGHFCPSAPSQFPSFR